ncbi:MAG: hypothetical protein LBD08_07855, partial [Treponema sp.]|nr:hypothetical protein [Treponema sp.]
MTCAVKPSGGFRGERTKYPMALRRGLGGGAPLLLCFFLSLPLCAQDGFGFGDSEETAAPPPALSVSGEAHAELIWYGDSFSSAEKAGNLTLGNIFSGKIGLKAAASNAEGVINLKLRPDFTNPASIVSLDEAYVRAFWGAFDLEAGLRKLTWGKADSFGPLDVINPADYTGLTDILDRKLPRPLLHGSYRLGSFSRVEAVFVPWFEADRYAEAGRWAPLELTDLPAGIEGGIRSLFPILNSPQAEQMIRWPVFSTRDYTPDTSTLGYAQGGLRFTSTAGPVDFGIQYYSGCLTRPTVTVKGLDTFQARIDETMQAYMAWQAAQTDEAKAAFEAARDRAANSLTPDVAYNRYHQIGVDYAQALGGFNLRAELAAILTEDLAGTDGAVKNPSLGWSAGFDRPLIFGISLNLQGSGSIRLLHDQISGNRAADAEAGTSMTSSRMTGVLSKKLLRDELEIKTTVIWG